MWSLILLDERGLPRGIRKCRVRFNGRVLLGYVYVVSVKGDTLAAKAKYYGSDSLCRGDGAIERAVNWLVNANEHNPIPQEV